MIESDIFIAYKAGFRFAQSHDVRNEPDEVIREIFDEWIIRMADESHLWVSGELAPDSVFRVAERTSTAE